MITSHLPNNAIATSSKNDVDYYVKAMYLIKMGYPVPEKDPEKLAKIIEEKDVERNKT